MALLNTIKEFQGSYRREGFSVIKIQGKQYLVPSGREWIENYSTSIPDDGDEDKMSRARVMLDLDNYTVGNNIIGIDEDGNIFINGLSPNFTSSYDSSYYPAIKTTTNNNIFFTNRAYLGCAYLFTADSATSTSLTVSGETFNSTYGINDQSTNNKIYNITKGEAYTNTTTTPTDTLNFSAASTTPEAGDEFLVFNEKRFSLNITTGQFSGQDDPRFWARQIKLSNNHYYILNGNYIARIDISDNDATNSTMEKNWQQLHRGRQALCFDMNKENILVATKYQGSSSYELFLYNEYSEGSLSNIRIPDEPKSIQSYKSGWIVLIQGHIYYTDGYQLQFIANIPDFESLDDYADIPINGVLYKGDKIYINCNSNTSRYGKGTYIYDSKFGWNFMSLKGHRHNLYLGALISNTRIIYSNANITSSNNQSTNIMLREKDFSPSNKNRVSFLLSFEEATKISQIGINFIPNYKQNLGVYSFNETRVVVNYGNTSRPLQLSGLQVGDGSSFDVVFPKGNTYDSKVGQKLLFTSGNVAGEVSYIDSISNSGTSSETWDISPNMTESIDNNVYFNKYNLYKSGEKTVSPYDIKQDITFSTTFYGHSLYFEIECYGSDLNISNINLYG